MKPARLSNAQKTAIFQQLSDAGHGAAANQLFGKPKEKTAKQPRRKKSKEENEVINILIFSLLAFAVGYYYLHQWGLIV